MTGSNGQCMVNGVALGELELSLLGADNIKLVAKLALVDTQSGTRYGVHTKVSWSDTTWEKVRDLVASIEADAVRTIFNDTTQVTVDRSAEDPIAGIPGL